MRRWAAIITLFVLAGVGVNLVVAVCLFGFAKPHRDSQGWLHREEWFADGTLVVPTLTGFEFSHSFGVEVWAYASHDSVNDFARRARIGLPLRTIEGGWVGDGSGLRYVTAIPMRSASTALSRWGFMPVGIIWPGFAFNTVFYAAILWLLIRGPRDVRRFLRRRRGWCLACGYDLRATTDGRCPECGAESVPSPKRARVLKVVAEPAPAPSPRGRGLG